jgi:hypothetical protein
MPGSFIRIQQLLFILTSLCLISSDTSAVNALSTLTRNDPFPVFTALDPQTMLLTHEKLIFREWEWAGAKKNNFSISISPFGQSASCAKPLYTHPTIFDNTGVVTSPSSTIAIGDLPCGPWNTIAMLYGAIPEGQELAPALVEAMNALFPNVAPGTLNDPSFLDPNKKLGFVTFPAQYRKRGIRFELESNFIGGFGCSIQSGLASIRLTTTHRDLTCEATRNCDFFPEAPAGLITQEQFDLFKDKTAKYLTQNLKNIIPEIGQCWDDYCGFSVEEIRLNLFWRHAFELNRNQDRDEWAQALMIPFFVLAGSFSPGKVPASTDLFGIPFGNNGHNAVGFNTGLMFDFIETIEFGAEVGVTHFFSRDFCNLPVPTHPCQCRLYPFKTDVTVSPGLNWFFGGKISAYHFLDKLSMTFEYIIVEHKMDRIKLKCPDPAFLPEVLEDRSTWKAKFIDMSFVYDISPNIALGLFWQAPISERGTFQSSTVMGTFNCTF